MKNFISPFSARLGPARAWRNPRHKRFWLLPLILLYTVGGFLLAPWAIQSQVIPRVAGYLGRPVSLDELRINPYVLSVEARGFRLTETDGSPLFEFERLFVNLQLSSLFRRAWTFREISLEGPAVEFMRDGSGQTNWERLFADFLAPDAAASQSTGDAELPRLIVGKLAILGGRIELTDHVPQPEVNSRLEPINFTAHDLSTLPVSAGRQEAMISVGAHGRVNWSGGLQLNPLLAEGHFVGGGRYLPIMYRYVEDYVTFEVSEGQAEFSLDYRIEAGDTGEIAVRIDNLDFNLSGIEMQTDDPVVKFLSLPEISLTSGRFLWPEQTVQFDGLSIADARLHVIRNPDGVLNLQQLLVPAEALPPAELQETITVHPLQDWSIDLGELKIIDFGVTFEDQSLMNDAVTTRAIINAHVRDISGRSDAQFPFAMDIRPDAGGTISLEGRLGLFPTPVLDASLQIDRLALQIAQPWVAAAARVEIDAGLFNADTRLRMDANEPLGLRGSLSVESLDVSDAVKHERLVGWGRLEIEQLVASVASNSLEVSAIGIEAPYVRILIAEDQATNFERLAVATDSTGSDDVEAADPAEALNVAIGQVNVAGGTADFTDLSLPLPFSAHIGALHGRISTLATASTEPAGIELEGRVNEYGMATVAGKLLPGNPAKLTDIQLEFRNVDIPDLSPYTVKFAGRSIDDGSLDVMLKYRVENGSLRGDNNVVIRELTLGDRIEHPGAATLPLGLAVALLKRPDGSIVIDMPVSGDVDDPEFSVGGLVFKAFVNLITKAATSPFRLLGGLVGMDAEGFDEIEFRPGRASLTPPELEKLAKLTEALTMRPGLGLSLRGAVDPVADTDAIKAERAEAMLAERMAATDSGNADRSLLTSRRRGVLEELVREQRPELDIAVLRAQAMRPADPAEPDGRQALDEPAYMAVLMGNLTVAVRVDEQDLDALAMARAGEIGQAVLADEHLTD